MKEVSSCLKMLDEVYKVFGLTYKAALSTRPDSYLGTLEQWDAAEGALKAALDQTGKQWEVRLSHLDSFNLPAQPQHIAQKKDTLFWLARL